LIKSSRGVADVLPQHLQKLSTTTKNFS